MSASQFFLRFVIALIVGVIIGVEREFIGKKAGIRTIMLVCSGSALYAMISIMMPQFAQNLYGEYTIRAVDMSRVISNIVVGIGFLGAGVIIKTQERVRGLTTAATIWISSAVGILIGIGMVSWGIVTGLIVALALFLLRGIDVSGYIKNK